MTERERGIRKAGLFLEDLGLLFKKEPKAKRGEWDAVVARHAQWINEPLTLRGERAIDIAARHNVIELGRALIKRGALVDERNWAGETPLALACEHASVEWVRELLAAGAEPNGLLRIGAGRADAMPLSVSECWRREEGADICAELVKAGGDGGEMFQYAMGRWTGQSDPMLADRARAVAERMMGAGVSVDRRGAGGETALWRICHYAGDSERGVEALLFLLSKGADPNVADEGGFTAMWGCLRENLAIASEAVGARIMTALLEAGADPYLGAPRSSSADLMSDPLMREALNPGAKEALWAWMEARAIESVAGAAAPKARSLGL